MAKKRAETETGGTNTGTPPGETMSKADAVRAAVAKGYDKPAAGVKYILDEFGIEITPGTFSATKAQQKPRPRTSTRSGSWWNSGAARSGNGGIPRLPRMR